MDRPLQSSNLQQRQSQVVLKLVFQLVRQRPWTCWGGLCAATVAVSGVALFGLFSPFFTRPAVLELDRSDTARFSQVTTQASETLEDPNILTTGSRPSQVQATLASETQPVPAWILGAIALGLSTSSLVLWYRLQPDLQPIFERYRQQQRQRWQQRQQRLKRAAARRTYAPHAAMKRPASTKLRQRPIGQPVPQRVQKRRQSQLATVAVPVQIAVPAIAYQPSRRPAPTSFVLSSPRKKQRGAPMPPPVPATAVTTQATPPDLRVPASEPTVTIVPAEENHPLDWHSKGLADALDLRKHHSLSAMLRRSSLDLPMEGTLRSRRLSMPLSET